MTVKNRGLVLLFVLLLAACGDDPAKMVASARDYIAKGDTNAAVIQLKSALQKNPDLAEARYLFATLLFDSGDSSGAEREFRKALDKGYPIEQIAVPLSYAMIGIGKAKDIVPEYIAMKPTGAEAVAAVNTGLANAYIATGENEKAEKAIKDAFAAQANYVPARLAQARLKMATKDLPGAMADLDALAKEPSVRYDALLLRADIFRFQDKPELALAEFNEGARLHSQALQPRLKAAQILLAQGKYDEADAKLAEARKLSPNDPTTRFYTGVIALQRGKPEAARDAAQQVLRSAPDFVPALLLSGLAQVQLKEYLQAQQSLEKVVAKVPGNVPARRLLARAYIGSGDSTHALETLEPLLSSDAPDREALSVAGEAALNMGDTKLSSEYFDRATKLDPQDANARGRLGISRLVGGDTERAVSDLEAASSLAGASAGGTSADVALIMVHLRRGEYDKARTMTEAFIQKHPDLPFAYNLLGGVMGASGDRKAERANFEKAFSLDGTYLPAAINLARLDRADGHVDVAGKRFQSIIDKAPKNPEAYLIYGRFLAGTGTKPDDIRKLLDQGIAANPGASSLRLAELQLLLGIGDKKAALSAAQDTIAAFPNDPAVLYAASQALAAAGDIQQAIATMQKVVGLRPDSPQALVVLSDLQRGAKDDAAAEDSLGKAIKLRPESVEARRRLAALKVDQHKGAEAVQVARDLQTLKPKEAAGYEIEGDVQAALKDWTASIAAFTRAVELGHHGAVAARLHNAMIQAGHKADADAFAARWLKDNPKDPAMRSYLGERALAAKAFDEAAKQYQALVELEPKNAVALNNLAWVAGQTKDPKAMSYVDRALQLAPDSPPILDTKGNLQMDAGQTSEGLATLKKAVSLAPDRGEIRLSLARALSRSGDKTAARGEVDTILKSAPQGSPLRQDAQNLLKTL
jgi:putative PEP-CTERM system TPR-repeat lipoprotein